MHQFFKNIRTLDYSRLNEEQKLACHKKILQEIYFQSLFQTAFTLLGYKDLRPKAHREMLHALENDTKRKLIVMPRGTFKSSISSVAYPIWRLIRNKEERILLDSELYTNSKNFLREIKDHLLTERFRSIFGDWRSEIWNESEVTIKPRKKILKEASLTASGIGAEKTGQHYDCIICDDLNSPSNSGTKEGQEKVIQHYRYLISILEPTGTLVIVGTRYAELDVIGYALKNEIENGGDNAA